MTDESTLYSHFEKEKVVWLSQKKEILDILHLEVSPIEIFLQKHLSGESRNDSMIS